ncbi:MAG: tRNA adenosine(34) deaminase TadA [Bdellovibrionaceae bacterium]|nr:tRNA adenosine(34) deaminase TadA [Pseudobdellovibrionaceae bacterium]MBX3034934.1 tRNA adenosine(34) deaminase TadA [Pseudobdellovibrionaceae bacterium]
MSRLSDEDYMKMALKWAEKAAKRDEVPIGAVLVAADGTVISHGYNMRENWKTPLAHAEIIAIQTAAKKLQQWRLLDTTLYVTLEPCPMCAGALVQARVGRLVYGATDPKAGATESLYRICSDARLNHRLEITRGVLEKECGEILTGFFRRKRQQKKDTSKN